VPKKNLVLLISCDAEGALTVDDDVKKTVKAGDTVRILRPRGQHIVRLTSGAYYDEKTVNLTEDQMAVSMQLATLLAGKARERQVLSGLPGTWVFTNEGETQQWAHYTYTLRSGTEKKSSDRFGICKWHSQWNLTLQDSDGQITGRLSRTLTAEVENNPSYPKQQYTDVRCDEFDVNITRASKTSSYVVTAGFTQQGTLQMQAKSTGCTGDCTNDDIHRPGDMQLVLDLRTPTQLGFWDSTNGWRIFEKR
jgi:hypothetical protein